LWVSCGEEVEGEAEGKEDEPAEDFQGDGEGCWCWCFHAEAVAGGLSESEGLDLDCPEDVGDLLNASGGEFFDYLVPVDPGVVTEDVAKRVLICLQIGGAEGLIGHALED
jgi:hypothetical protein